MVVDGEELEEDGKKKGMGRLGELLGVGKDLLEEVVGVAKPAQVLIVAKFDEFEVKGICLLFI